MTRRWRTTVDEVDPAPVLPDPPTPYCTLEQAAVRLRMLPALTADPPDPDVDWLTECWRYACQQLDIYFIDRPLTAPYPPGAVTACIGITSIAFRAKDTMSDQAEEFDSTLPPRVPRVPLEQYEGWLYGLRWGGSWSPA